MILLVITETAKQDFWILIQVGIRIPNRAGLFHETYFRSGITTFDIKCTAIFSEWKC